MKKVYRLFVSFPLNVPTIQHDTATLIALVGSEPDGMGAGFGMRDVDFSFDNETDRARAMAKLRATGKYTMSKGVDDEGQLL